MEYNLLYHMQTTGVKKINIDTCSLHMVIFRHTKYDINRQREDVMYDITQQRQEHLEKITQKTYSVKQLAEVLNIGENKARCLTRIEGFPVLVLGNRRLTIISKLDEWLESNAGNQIQV